MNIAFIVREFPTLSETFIFNQITGLIDLGHKVVIFSSRKGTDKKIHPDVSRYSLIAKTRYTPTIPGNIVARLFKAIGLMICNLYKNPLLILGALNFFKLGRDSLTLRSLYVIVPFLDNDYDIIQCHFGSNGDLGALLKQIGLKGKLVTMFHGLDIRQGIKEGGKIYHRLFKYGDCFLSISDYNRRHLLQFGADPGKIVFHPVGVDIEKFSVQRKSTAQNRTKKIIITVARLSEEKGLFHGINAIDQLVKKLPRVRVEYQIIGSGPLENDLKEYVKDHGLDELVLFLGPLTQEEVVKKMREADIYFLPSVNEATPLVLMEAQSMCLPVVASRVGGVMDLLVDGESGYLVPSGDVDVMAEKLRFLLEHEERWETMGIRGRKHIHEKYNIKKLNIRLSWIYEELVLEKKRK